jgi:hypothetical protein
MKFSPEGPSGRHLESFFASLIDSPAHDFNLALSRLLETAVQFSLQDTAGIPAKSLGTWYGAAVVAILGALLDTQTNGFRYGSKKEGHPQAFILKGNPNQKGRKGAHRYPQATSSSGSKWLGNFRRKTSQDALLLNNRVSISAAH